MNLLKLLCTLYLFTFSIQAFANTRADHHAPIDHCYHWVDEKNGNKGYLTHKYNYAKANGNDLTFFTTPGTSKGSVAGAGLYCAKSPSGSYTYGDRVIRVELVDDVVLYDELSRIKYCGKKETSQNSAKCAAKSWDIKFYSGGGRNNKAWYVIRDSRAVKAWSSNSDKLIADLRKSQKTTGSSDASFRNHIDVTINYINAERTIMGQQIFYNANARASIIDFILKDPAKLDNISPLAIVTQVALDGSGRLTDAQRDEVLKKYFYKSLTAVDVAYADYKEILEASELARKIYIPIAKLALKNIEKNNAMVLFRTMMDYKSDFQNYKLSVYDKLVAQIFANSYHLDELATEQIELDQFAKRYIAIQLTAYEKKEVDLTKFTTLPRLIEKAYSKKTAKKKKQLWLRKVFGNGGEYQLTIQDISFDLDKGDDFVAKCTIADNFAKRKGEVFFKVKNAKIPLGNTNTTKIGEICKTANNLAEIVKDIPEVELMGQVNIIKGFIGPSNNKQHFAFVVRNQEDLAKQCKAFYPKIKDTAYNGHTYYTANGSSQKNFYSYGTSTEKTYCAHLRKSTFRYVPTKARLNYLTKIDELNENAPEKVKGYHSAVINIHGYQEYLHGFSTDEMREQCLTLYDEAKDARGGSSPSEAYVEVAGQSNTKVSAYGGWKDAESMCHSFNTEISRHVPSDLKIEREQVVLANNANANANNLQLHYIDGRLGDIWPYYLTGYTLEEIQTQCEKDFTSFKHFASNRYNYYIVNSVEKGNHQNYGGFSDGKNLCNKLVNAINDRQYIPTQAQIDAEAKREKVKKEIAKRSKSLQPLHYAIFRIGMRVLFLEGEHSDEFEKQCQKLMKDEPEATFSKRVYYAVNENSQNNFNLSSYRRNITSFCSDVKKRLHDNGVPTSDVHYGNVQMFAQVKSFKRKSALRKKNKLQSKYSELHQLHGTINGIPFYFYGANRDELKAACVEYTKGLSSDSGRYIYYKLYTEDQDYTTDKVSQHSDRNRWSTKDQLCDNFYKVIAEVPTKRHYELLKVRDDLNHEVDKIDADYKVFGDFEGHQFVFAADNADVLKEQCTELVGNLETVSLNRIKFEVNGEDKGLMRLTGSHYPATNVTDVCHNFFKIINNYVPTIAELKKQEEDRKKQLVLNKFIAESKSNFKASDATYHISGKFQDDEFYFYAENYEGIIQQCREYYPRIVDSTKIATLSVGVGLDGKQRKSRVSSSFTINSAHNLCDQQLGSQLSGKVMTIAEIKAAEILRKRVEALKTYTATKKAEYDSGALPYKIAGKIGKNPFYIAANYKEQMVEICHEYIEKQPVSLFYENYILKIQDAEEKPIALEEPSENFCENIGLNISMDIPNKELKDRMDLMAKYKAAFDTASAAYKINIQFEGAKGAIMNNIYLTVSQLEEIQDQCLSQYPNLEFAGKVKKINYQVNDAEVIETKLAKYEKENEESFCQSIQKTIYFEVPNVYSLNLKQEFEDTNANYKVSGILGKRPFYLFGNDEEEIFKQCLERYDDFRLDNLKQKIKHIRLKVNDEVELRDYKVGGLFNRKKATCKLIKKKLKVEEVVEEAEE